MFNSDRNFGRARISILFLKTYYILCKHLFKTKGPFIFYEIGGAGGIEGGGA